MPSSKDRRRLEVPAYMYDRLVEIANTEDRTVASVLAELLFSGLSTYQPAWVPSKHLSSLNERARGVLERARDEARGLNHNYVGTEHLLLGLLGDTDSVAGQALAGLGVTLERARDRIAALIGRGTEPSPDAIDFVPRVRRVLGLALEEAQRLNSGLVRSEHILLALVREGGGIAAEVLDEFGVLGRAREVTLERLRGSNTGGTESA